MTRAIGLARAALAAAAVLTGASATPILAATATETYTKPFNASGLDGYWVTDDASRRANTSRAQLTPAGQAVAKANTELQATRLARGQVVGLGTYICGLQGVPFIYTTSEPYALVVTKDEVVQVAERPSLTPRHFYTDGRDWPDLTKMPLSTSGYSIGHWEGNDLVVETRGLTTGGTPGGGLKGPKSILHERFSVVEGGKRMKVTFSIEDPDLVAKPAVLEYMYDREPAHTYAFADFCDPNLDMAKTVSPTGE